MMGLIPGMFRPAFRPAAELRQALNYRKRLESELVLAEPASAVRRLEHTEQVLGRTINGLIQATLPGPSVGYIMLAVARRLLRGIAQPRELEAVLRGLPHNVTTEMDLELWQLAVSIATTRYRAGSSWRNSPRNWPPPISPASCRPRPSPACAASSPATATARWRKSTLACPAGPGSPTISSA